MEYNLEYLENLIRLQSKTAQDIAERRWAWISDLDPKTVLDYGCGAGWFRAFRTNGAWVDSYDIGPYAQTGIRRKNYDVVCFFDVLEHMKTLEEVSGVVVMAKYVAGTVPIIQDCRPLQTWKHYKPGEHFQYWSEAGFEAAMEAIGLVKIAHGWVECPPREDIMSFKYRRV